MFNKVLIANRGAIACRIMRTLRKMGVGSVAVYSQADRHARHVTMADDAICIGPAPAPLSYLDADAILAAAKLSGAQAIHPGYGFLSENPGFAEACARAGVRFIGPTPDNMRAFGLKHTARELAQAADVPLAPGSGLLRDVADAQQEAARIGYPVMLKSTAGGGGIGLQLIAAPDDLAPMYERVERLARNNFKDAGLFLEKFVARGRHIEVQIFGDGKGRVVALGERDCSAQRRNQKVLEETPAPGLSEATRRALWNTAVRLGESVAYESAGTVEFLYDNDTAACYFLEVNTRLQVEHGVTEEVTGIDLVEWMVRQAAGEILPLDQSSIQPAGASIQARVYAEDPAHDFRPCAGTVTHASWGQAEARIETWVESGTEVSAFYDPMLAKIIATGATREEALRRLSQALDRSRVYGIETNLPYLRQLVASDVVSRGEVVTCSLADFEYAPNSIDVLSAGTQTTIQDYPGRLNYWNVGVPPSGPMDDYAFQLANVAVGNAPGVAALEITLQGPVLRFNAGMTICLTGAEMAATLDGEAVAFWTPIAVSAGQTLKIGSVKGAGVRAYLAIRGGIEVPSYLGSAATFTLGKFGGLAGRALLAGDVMHVCAPQGARDPAPVEPGRRPVLTHAWTIGVLHGPHGAPDFFTQSDIDTLFAAEWKVHYNSNRTGVRLIGPRPQWARTDGGEAGLHPSNIHDNAYAIGAVDFTGDMPVILGPDGPSLGGFVCPVTAASPELWKIGQLRPGDTVRFEPISAREAQRRANAKDEAIAAKVRQQAIALSEIDEPEPAGCILAARPASGRRPAVTYRRQGDCNLLVEYGPIVLDIELRLRVHALEAAIGKSDISGIVDLTPGIRSLQVHFDRRSVRLADLLDALAAIEDGMGEIDDMEVPSRIVQLPLSWNDPQVQLTIDKYMQSVRPDAPWCPSNIEFIRRINGLPSTDEVYRTVFEASYLVLGLGDVYLGAPVATPVDPRHRLVTTKYNPARTWTPDNVVGIGGAYMCIYGMEGPGGYQLFGRTCQVWNTYRETTAFEAGKPWLLRFFDQIRFYPVSPGELLAFRDGLLTGKASIAVEPAAFRLSDYRAFLASQAQSIAVFKSIQQQAFEAERARWQAADQSGAMESAADNARIDRSDLADGSTAVTSPVPGAVWRIAVEKGQRVEEGETLVIVESMKMEMIVAAYTSGIVTEIRCSEGQPAGLGQILLVMAEAQTEAAS